MLTSQFCLRLFAYSKASLLLSLEGLTDLDIRWQPKPAKASIGWHACHVGQFRGALMGFFDREPDWDALGPLRQFGYGSSPDELRDRVPPRQRLVELIHEDWLAFLPRFRQFGDGDLDHPVPLNNPDGETLLEMCHRTAWHCDHHVGRICGLRSLLGKPSFPRPAFGTIVRRRLRAKSETGWERLLMAIDPEMRL